MSASLTLTDIACVRGDRTLFDGVSLAIAPGEATAVTGPNGVGKSSLIRIAAGLLTPTTGSVERTGDQALMAEASALDAERSLGDALRFWAALDGRADAVSDALEAVGLAPLADVPVRWLSTGQRRRAALARVIASGAPIWLLDEPANGLDTQSIAMLEGVVARHRASGGIALIATHIALDMPAAREIAL